MRPMRALLNAVISGDAEPDETGCILWPGAIAGRGYPVATVDSEQVYVTRYVLEALVGPPPTEKHVAAHAPHDVCGNLNCINPKHLRWATYSENNGSDREHDGTLLAGERHPNSTLTETEAREIKRLCREGPSQREIAKRFGITQQHVSSINVGRRWPELEDVT